MRDLCTAALAAMMAACGHAAADEGADFGIASTYELRLDELSAPTPRELPGTRTIRTSQLKEWLRHDGTARPLLFDVLGGTGHDTIPSAVWLPGAGRGYSLTDPVQAQLARTLEALTRSDRARPMVFFCSGVRCWLSYNAALRAAALGYRSVYWYRGGIEAWVASDGELAPARFKWVGPAD